MTYVGGITRRHGLLLPFALNERLLGLYPISTGDTPITLVSVAAFAVSLRQRNAIELVPNVFFF